MQHHLEALQHRKQFIFEMRTCFGDHIIDRQPVFDLGLIDQTQFIHLQLTAALGLIQDQLIEALMQGFIKFFEQSFTLETNLAHGFKIHAAFIVRFNFFGKPE